MADLVHPAEPAVDVILRDGTTLRLRPPTETDVRGVMAFFADLSDRSRFLRFHGFTVAGDRFVRSFVEPDWAERGSLIGVMGDAADEPMVLMRATQDVNDLQRRRTLRTIADALGGLNGRRIAVLGLAFKPGTNDIRESAGLEIVRQLRGAGADVVAWDGAVTAAHLPGPDATIELAATPLDAVRGADAAVLCTEWPEATQLDLAAAAAVMRGTVLVDGRYMWDRRKAADAGLDLLRVGSLADARLAVAPATRGTPATVPGP